MKVDLSKEILNRKGETIKSKIKIPFIKINDNGEEVEEIRFQTVTLTLGKALRDSVLTTNNSLTVEQKMLRFNLFLKIENDEEVDLTEEEIEMLKEFACERYEVIYFGTIVNLMK